MICFLCKTFETLQNFSLLYCLRYIFIFSKLEYAYGFDRFFYTLFSFRLYSICSRLPPPSALNYSAVRGFYIQYVFVCIVQSVGSLRIKFRSTIAPRRERDERYFAVLRQRSMRARTTQQQVRWVYSSSLSAVCVVFRPRELINHCQEICGPFSKATTTAHSLKRTLSLSLTPCSSYHFRTAAATEFIYSVQLIIRRLPPGFDYDLRAIYV